MPKDDKLQRTMSITRAQDSAIDALRKKRCLGESRAQIVRAIIDAGVRALTEEHSKRAV